MAKVHYGFSTIVYSKDTLLHIVRDIEHREDIHIPDIGLLLKKIVDMFSDARRTRAYTGLPRSHNALINEIYERLEAYLLRYAPQDWTSCTLLNEGRTSFSISYFQRRGS
jgi:hypothetical protein